MATSVFESLRLVFDGVALSSAALTGGENKGSSEGNGGLNYEADSVMESNQVVIYVYKSNNNLYTYVYNRLTLAYSSSIQFMGAIFISEVNLSR